MKSISILDKKLNGNKAFKVIFTFALAAIPLSIAAMESQDRDEKGKAGESSGASNRFDLREIMREKHKRKHEEYAAQEREKEAACKKLETEEARVRQEAAQRELELKQQEEARKKQEVEANIQKLNQLALVIDEDLRTLSGLIDKRSNDDENQQTIFALINELYDKMQKQLGTQTYDEQKQPQAFFQNHYYQHLIIEEESFRTALKALQTKVSEIGEKVQSKYKVTLACAEDEKRKKDLFDTINKIRSFLGLPRFGGVEVVPDTARDAKVAAQLHAQEEDHGFAASLDLAQRLQEEEELVHGGRASSAQPPQEEDDEQLAQRLQEEEYARDRTV
jgi:hypothetical protein